MNWRLSRHPPLIARRRPPSARADDQKLTSSDTARSRGRIIRTTRRDVLHKEATPERPREHRLSCRGMHQNRQQRIICLREVAEHSRSQMGARFRNLHQGLESHLAYKLRLNAQQEMDRRTTAPGLSHLSSAEVQYICKACVDLLKIKHRQKSEIFASFSAYHSSMQEKEEGQEPILVKHLYSLSSIKKQQCSIKKQQTLILRFLLDQRS